MSTTSTLTVTIPLEPNTVNDFKKITDVLHGTSKQNISAHDIGVTLADFADNLLYEVFGNLIDHMEMLGHSGLSKESKATLAEISAAFHKYLPWAISRFSLQRLTPFIDYFFHLIKPAADGTFHHISYPLSTATSQKIAALKQAIDNQNAPSNRVMMNTLIESIDDSLEYLLFKPKATLQFNFVVDKTINGVISVTSKLAYRQLHKAADHLKPEAAIAMTRYLLQLSLPDTP